MEHTVDIFSCFSSFTKILPGYLWKFTNDNIDFLSVKCWFRVVTFLNKIN